jgi:Holliday junction resolvase RusA-like endonuclease
MTRSDVWKQRPAVLRYRAFADELRLKYREDLPYSVKLRFEIAMPKSWSAKRRAAMRGLPHQQKPDWDNLAKAVQDALLPEDSVVWRCLTEKVWADEGAIVIEPYETDR